MNQSIQNSNSENLTPWHLGWDAILFILLWSAQFWSSEVSGMLLSTPANNVSLIVFLTRVLAYDPMPGLLLIVLFLYIGADLWLHGRAQFALKLVLVWLTIFAFVITPTIAAIVYRHNGVPYLYAHDGMIQIEEAAKFLLAGKNPYVENYIATPMGQWPYHDPGMAINPALYHLIYLPFFPLFSIPFYLVSQLTIGWFDERFIYLLLLILSGLMALNIARTPRDGLAALMILCLNPLFVPFFIEGRNDLVISFCLLGAILLLQKRRIGWAGLLVACAAASKQTIWFLIPFFVLYVVGSTHDWRKIVERARPLIPAAILFCAVLLPFVLWNAGAHIDDTISYQAGTSAPGTNYPIKSLGLGGLALGMGWIQDPNGAFPYTGLEFGVVGLVFLFLLYRQWRNNTLLQLILNFALLFLVYGFFSRVFNDNHLGFALTWLLLPSFITDAKVTEGQSVPVPLNVPSST